VYSDVLCFMKVAVNKIASKPLKALISEFYTSDQISSAKESLLAFLESKSQKPDAPYARRRYSSVSKTTIEIDDIHSMLLYVDENNIDIPHYVSDSPFKMPSIRLVEGDLKILWEKIDRIEEAILKNSISLTDISEVGKGNNVILSGLTDLPKTMSDICPALEGIRSSQVQITNTLGASVSERAAGLVVSRKSSAACWGLSESEMDNANDSGPAYQDVINKKKRKKENSPITGSSAQKQSFASALVARPAGPSQRVTPVRPALNPASRGKLVGSREGSRLKAAPPSVLNKSLFCVSNVSVDSSPADILRHCRSQKVRALFCFDISSSSSTAKAYKLAIATDDVPLLSRTEFWPQHVRIRPWRGSGGDNPARAAVPVTVTIPDSAESFVESLVQEVISAAVAEGAVGFNTDTTSAISLLSPVTDTEFMEALDSTCNTEI